MTRAAHPRWPRYAAGLGGFAWFLEIGGGPTLDPRHTALIMSGDWMQHWFGWLMFRREPWTFPLGTISGMPYPIGTTIGYTDSNPLVSLLLKPFSGVLPEEMQFIGLWLAVCFTLQGYLGAALASAVTDEPREQLFGGLLFVLSPVLVARIAHDTLSAHWLLLCAMYLGLRSYSGEPAARRGAWRTAGMVVLAALVHPYLATMCWIVAMSGFVRLGRTRLLPVAGAGMFAAGTTAAMVAVFWAIGYFGSMRMGASGFGQYSADLLALVNPDQFSRLLTRFRLGTSQWEGLGFLGLGGLAAAGLALIVVIRDRPKLRPGTWAVVAGCLLMAVYSLSWNITLGGRTVINTHAFYEPFTAVTAPFRASGRFIWALHYLVLAGGIWGAARIVRVSRESAGATILALIVVLQAMDLKIDTLWAQAPIREVPFNEFTAAVGRYRHLALVPMQVRGVCSPYQENHVFRYMLHAYRMKTTYNSGYFARVSGPTVAAECERLDRDVDAGMLNSQTIYVVAADRVPKFQAARAACGRIDGDWVCVSRDSDEVFRTALETGRMVNPQGK